MIERIEIAEPGDRRTMLFWREDYKVRGLIVLAPFRQEEDTVKILDLWVAPGYRRAGIGTSLVNAGLRYVREEDYLEAVVEIGGESYREEKTVFNFFKSAGFSIDYSFENNDKTRMRRVLLASDFGIYKQPRPLPGDVGEGSMP